MARSVKPLSCIIVDYLGLIKPEQPGSRYETITAISGALKQLAMSERVPVLALAQLNRAAEQRAGNKPTLSDLRDSGAMSRTLTGCCCSTGLTTTTRRGRTAVFPPSSWR